MSLASALLLSGACFAPAPLPSMEFTLDSECKTSWASVPSAKIVRQTIDSTRAAASVATLANLLGVASLSEKDVVAVLGKSQLISVSDLVEAAGKVNLPLKPFSATLESLKKIPLPAIVLLTPKVGNKLTYYVVLLNVGSDSVVYADPAKGKITVPLDEFLLTAIARDNNERPVVIMVPQVRGTRR
jgi:predicted double-glycine peptidase